MSSSSIRTTAVTKVLDDLGGFEIDLQAYWDDAEPQSWFDSILTGKVKSLLAFCRSMGWSSLVATLEGMLPLRGDAPEVLEQIQSFVIPEARHLLGSRVEKETTMSRFSDRHGYKPDEPEITVRNDAPEELREVLLDLAYESGLTPHPARTIVCRLLRKREDSNNWSEYPNVDGEVRGLIGKTEWYRVYDVIEALHDALDRPPPKASIEYKVDHFDKEINDYFRQAGIGWQILDGKIETRGSEAFEKSLKEASTELADSGRATASNEIHQALADLSRRPKPDITGAIQHALASLECVVRDVAGDPKSTLGALLGRNPDLVPAPLNQGLEKMWGFASEQGRHLREGREPSYEEAVLIVQVSAAVGLYLSKKAGATDIA